MTDAQLLLFLVQVVGLVFLARLAGELATRLGVPVVVGELLCGILVGPSVIGAIWPGVYHHLFPHDPAQQAMLEMMGWLGVTFVVLHAGMEAKLERLLKARRMVACGWAGGFLLPLGLGFLVGLAIPSSLIGPGIDRRLFALFVATAMSISAVPVIVRILLDTKLLHTRVGELTVATAIMDDTAGWILLVGVSGVAGGGTNVWHVAQVMAMTAVFLIASLTVGRQLVKAILNIAAKFDAPHAETSAVLLLVLAFGAATQAIGVHLVLGVFIAGFLIGNVMRNAPRARDIEVTNAIQTVGMGFFVPLFFAYSGTKVNLTTLHGDILGAAFLVLAVACTSKIVGAGGGAWLGGLPRWEALAVGVGRNARGAMELVVATIGLSLGIITAPMYAIVVLVAMVTSVAAAPLLHFTVHQGQKRSVSAARVNEVRTGHEPRLAPKLV